MGQTIRKSSGPVTRRSRRALPATHLVPVEKQAENHRRTRRANSSEIAEDYIEVIADLIDTAGEARATDIAKRFGVTHASSRRGLIAPFF